MTGEAEQVGVVRGEEGRPGEPGSRATPDDDGRAPRQGAPQVELVAALEAGGEPEGVREDLGTVEVRLLELKTSQVAHLDDGVPRPTGVLAGKRSLLAVQVVVRVMGRHALSF